MNHNRNGFDTQKCRFLVCYLLSMLLCNAFTFDEYKSIKADRFINVSQLNINADECSTKEFHKLFENKAHNYQIDEHTVITSDNYVQKLFKVGLTNEDKQKRGINKRERVLYLQHGVLDSGDGWFINDETKSPGFYLLDKGFDVWVGNSRGNKYSHEHVDNNISNEKYWKFSFSEMGLYDLPAVYAYILEKEKKEKLTFIGHSQGTTQFITALTDPEFTSVGTFLTSRTEHFIAQSPVVYFKHLESSFAKFGSSFQGMLEPTLAFFGVSQFFPSDCKGKTFLKSFAGFLCYYLKFICDNLPLVPINPDTDEWLDDIPLTLSHYPSGIGVHTTAHFAQLINLGSQKTPRIQKFDFGKTKNMIIYGTENPTEYIVSKLTDYDTKISFIAAEADELAPKKDVEYFISQLDPKKYTINFVKGWNHISWFMPRDPKIFFKLLDQELGLD